MDDTSKRVLRECRSRQTLAELLRGLNGTALTASESFLINRKLDQLKATPDVRVAFMGSHNLEPLPIHTRVLAAVEGLELDLFVGEYNQYYQDILDPQGGLIVFDPNAIFLSVAIEAIVPEVFDDYEALPIAARRALIPKAVDHVSHWARHASERTRAHIFISNFTIPDFAHGIVSDLHDAYGYSEFFLDLNLALLRELKTEPRIHVLDMEGLIARFGKRAARDAKLHYLAKQQWSVDFARLLAEQILRRIKACGAAKKCLVVDMDNTLWGGILGEDGPLGVKIGPGDPVGEAFLDLQRRLRGLKNRGVILAASSKNNLEDVQELFKLRQDMPLRLEDFSAIEVGWNTKSESLRKIAHTLNIGLDSLVFLDDSPFECNLVRELVPEVTVVQLPDDPVSYPELIESFSHFDRLTVTEADKDKTAQYGQNQAREQHKQQVQDLESYLHSLETEVHIRFGRKADVERVHQLFSKTNQFNLTTIRYSVADIESFISSPAHELGVVSARDIFGNLGVIGLYLLEFTDAKARLDSFILSCRAMGRGIEAATMNYIKRRLLERKSELIEAQYLPTAKNRPTANLCEEHGFAVTTHHDSGRKAYSLITAGMSMAHCPWIKITGA